eukprot:gene10858-13905_t
MLTGVPVIAVAGTRMAECAGKDKYFDVIDAVMRGQHEYYAWGESNIISRPILARIAQSFGLSETAFNTCATDAAALARLQADHQAALKAGVTSSPTLFVNGKALERNDLDSLEAAIAARQNGEWDSALQFQKIKLSGFKSFVDATEFRIDPGLTGIVGPNGCGKSNLLEALRWVMGATSAKAMRGSGMDDVIFAGSDKRPSRNWAEVTLTIDNADRLAPQPFTDQPILDVARRIDRGAGSSYKINGKE